MTATLAGQAGAASRRLSLAALLLGVFTVSASFGLVLPLAPQLVRSAGAGDTAMHAGALTALYMLAIALFAPVWGRLSDRRGRRLVLGLGLTGFALSMGAFALVQSLPGLYVQRALSGLFAAAVAPVAAAFIADVAPSDQWRAARMAWLNMAAIAGFVLGPALSIWASALGAGGAAEAAGVRFAPFGAAALLAGVAAAGVAFALPRRLAARPGRPGPLDEDRLLARVLLGLTFAAALIVGVFEVSVSLRSGRLARISPAEVAAMFAVCSLVMFLAQAVLFSPLVRAARTWRFLVPGFALLSLALFLGSAAGDFGVALTVVTLIAASAGAVSPTLAYWLSMVAGRRQGAQLGRQVAAASLGQAVGSAGGGLLLSRLGGGDPFLWAAALAAAGAIAALLIGPRLAGLAAPDAARAG